MLPDQPHVTLSSSSQNRIFQYIDRMLLSMEPFTEAESNDNIEEIEENTVRFSVLECYLVSHYKYKIKLFI